MSIVLVEVNPSCCDWEKGFFLLDIFFNNYEKKKLWEH
jgi:hypothetical protein